jgi:hypothetical protein
MITKEGDIALSIGGVGGYRRGRREGKGDQEGLQEGVCT